jgi:hypothetical protein
MKKTIVLAGSRKQFEQYLVDNGLSANEALYGWCAEAILGTKADKVVETGTFYENKDYHKLKEIANASLR